jgi:hypothetical protein
VTQLKLTERARVKRLLKVAEADTINDELYDALIDQVSTEAEQICRRHFTYNPNRVEYYQSYEQNPFDPDPQYLWLDGPIDPDVQMVIVWAAYDQHDANGITLNPTPANPIYPYQNEDYRIDYDRSLVIIKSSTGSVANMPIPAGVGLPVYSYSPTGFRVSYAGGYRVLEKPDSEPDDPLDDWGVVLVPVGLRHIIAKKVAADLTTYDMAMPWGLEERNWLKPWMKRDLII